MCVWHGMYMRYVPHCECMHACVCVVCKCQCMSMTHVLYLCLYTSDRHVYCVGAVCGMNVHYIYICVCVCYRNILYTCVISRSA